MSKADRIRKCAAKHPLWSTTRIGEACDCGAEYVRVVLRQRVGGKSKNDRRYLDRFVAEHGVVPTTVRYRADPDFRRDQLARGVQWDKKNPERRREISHASYTRRKQREAANA